ncbi:MAG: XRE family transcriptional regulator, partial [Lachnospiraceae bacterium]|nr:XRE family transcriptional regulator [Lachnospiraceae bacterium]
MIHAYDKIYLSKAQTNMGRMLDFAVYDMKMDLREYYDLFLVSRISKSFAKGNPAYVAGMSGIELCYEVLDSVGFRYKRSEPHCSEDRSPEYWTGWALAYYQWYSGSGFSDIDRSVPIEKIIRMYSPYHEMDVRQFADRMDELTHKSRTLRL